MMLDAIFLKEYIKIRWFWTALLMLNILLMVGIFIDTRRLFMLDHAEIVWYRAIHLEQIHYVKFKYAPAITGLILACVQYLPEMRDERLRLTLHLPVSPHRLIISHVLVGLTAVSLIIALDLGFLSLITARYFPWEAVVTVVATGLPWGVCGLSVYLGVTMGLLEPNNKRKLFNLALAAGVSGLFLVPTVPGGYRDTWAILALLVLFMIPAVLLPVYHFRYRRAT